jgi:hypothetical protein
MRHLARVAPLFRPSALRELKGGLVGADAVEFAARLYCLVAAVNALPLPYETKGEAVAYLRYVRGDGAQVFILEASTVAEFDRCTGYVCLPGCAGWGEAGRVTVPDLLAEGYDLDSRFSPRTLARALEDYPCS